MKHARTRRFGAGGPVRRILLVAPRHPPSFWSLQGTAELFGTRTLLPNAALATLVALTPPDLPIEYALADENVGPIDLVQPCELAAVTASTLHAPRASELCRAFRQRGIPVALGGPWATLEPERSLELADFHFQGEAEHTWPRFLREWCAGRAKPVYRQRGFVDLADSPPPDWSLIDPDHYLNIGVQTTRGCPNRCDFCDVIQYVGRRVRTKPLEQVLAEVRAAHALGARSVFFSDDNFLGKPAYTRELLGRLVAWNREQDRPLSFSTQITMAVADDEELLGLLADARFSVLFLGLETPRRACLQEVHKLGNLSGDPAERIARISRHGLVPFLGLIVGFDADDESTFDELYAFVRDTAAPIVGLSLLNAPRGTPLYRRLQAEGRLVGDDFGGEWQLGTNVVPAGLGRERLLSGYWELFARLYEPRAFGERLARWLAGVERRPSPKNRRRRTDLRQWLLLRRLALHFLLRAPVAERRMFVRAVADTLRIDPGLLRRTFTLLAQYRHFADFVREQRPG